MIWNIQLLGGLAAHGPQGRIRRFRSQKSASLLAYLAFHQTSQPRETLIALLWPDAEAEVGRHNLSMALSFLRHQLEPPGVPPGSVIVADRFSVRLNPAAVTADALEFDRAYHNAIKVDLPEANRVALLLEACESYQGALLPGFYEEWISQQQLRLECQYVEALVQLVAVLLAAGKRVNALEYARRAVTADPLSEIATHSLMRALIEAGQRPEALKAYTQWEARLREDLGATPSDELQGLAAELRKGDRASNPDTSVNEPQKREKPTPRSGIQNSPERLARTFEADTDWFPSHNRLIGAEFLLRTTTRFFGRSDEVESLSIMLSSPRSRLVTLTGSGGTGKTRLALEVAAQVTESKGAAGTSAVFVSLRSVSEPERIFEAVLRALGIPASSDSRNLEQLASVLDARRNTLLVLDNFEHLVHDGALLLRDLLAKTGSVRLLVTSRQRLLVEGEREYRLSPLPVPVGAQTPEDLMAVPSIALFVDRAQAVLPDFQLTIHNASTVAKLCATLEGLPLAIELAAARIGSLSPNRILEQIQADRLDFLVSRRRDVQSRQKTLRATLDWSYQLLPESTRVLLAGLSVFRGGWTLSGAAAICSLSESETLEHLTLLMDNSLISVMDQEDGMRFTILETIREYGWENLIESGQKDIVCRRHCDYFASLAGLAEPELTGRLQVLWINRLQTEHDNLCAAIQWCEADERSAQAGLSIVGALWRFWEVRGYLSLGRKYLARAIDRCELGIPTEERAKALHGAGVLAARQGDYVGARSLLQVGLKEYKELADDGGIAASTDSLGRLAEYLGDNDAALPLYEEALRIHRKLGDRAGTASSLNSLAFMKLPQDGYAATKPLFEESLKIRREVGDHRGIAISLASLAYLACAQGDYDEAESLARESLLIRQQLGDKRGTADSLDRLASIVSAKRNYQLARALLMESLNFRRDLGDKDGIAHALYGLGALAHVEGDFENAFSLLQESLNIFRQTGGFFLIHVLGLVGHTARDIGDYNRAQVYYRESLNLRVARGDLLAVVMSLEDFSALALLQSNLERAALLLGAAESLCLKIGRAAPAGSQAEYRRTVDAVRQELGEEAFGKNWMEGRAMTQEQAVEYAMEVEVGLGKRKANAG